MRQNVPNNRKFPTVKWTPDERRERSGGARSIMSGGGCPLRSVSDLWPVGGKLKVWTVQRVVATDACSFGKPGKPNGLRRASMGKSRAVAAFASNSGELGRRAFRAKTRNARQACHVAGNAVGVEVVTHLSQGQHRETMGRSFPHVGVLPMAWHARPRSGIGSSLSSRHLVEKLLAFDSPKVGFIESAD